MSGIDKHDYKYKKIRPGQHRSRHESWKLVIKAMYKGKWMTLPQIQETLKVRRTAVRKVLNGMLKAGILETKKKLTFERSKGNTEWLPADATSDGKPVYKRRDGLLPRNYRYYRLRKEMISITIEKDPSK